MPREAAAWGILTDVMDSTRHELVEKPWYGREVKPDIDAKDIPAMDPAFENELNDIEAPPISDVEPPTPGAGD